METICANNNIDLSRYVLSALLMFTDQCEAEGILPRSKGAGKAAPRKKASGNGGSEEPGQSADSGEVPGVPAV